MIKSIIILIRPEHWLKNLFVLTPAFFAGSFLATEVMRLSLLTFISFSALASSVYVYNDWIDRIADSRHLEKRNRPIASGAINGRTALFSGIFMLMISIIISFFFLNHEVLAVIGIYFVLNLAYTHLLKKLAIVDVTCISTGFVLRLEAGSTATGIELSSWIITMTFLLAMFLALSKRRDDLIREQRGEEQTRLSIKGYNLGFLNQAMAIMGAVVIVAYIQFCHTVDLTIPISNSKLYLTSIFVLIGLLRYMQLLLVEERSGNPISILLEDRFTLINLLIWVGLFALVLYG